MGVQVVLQQVTWRPFSSGRVISYCAWRSANTAVSRHDVGCLSRDIRPEDYEELLGLDSGQKKGASKEAISRLPVTTLDKVEGASNTKCVICLSPLESGQRVKRLPCLCIFHDGCIGT